MENEQQLLFPGMSNFAFVFERYLYQNGGKGFPRQLGWSELVHADCFNSRFVCLVNAQGLASITTRAKRSSLVERKYLWQICCWA